jgi:hypothetical protein
MRSDPRADEPEIGGGLRDVRRFFSDPCGCGSRAAYGACCASAEGDAFIAFCDALSLERDMALEIGQLAWRIARDSRVERWRSRVENVADEMFADEPDSRLKLVCIVTALLDAHRIMFPGVDGSLVECN